MLVSSPPWAREVRLLPLHSSCLGYRPKPGIGRTCWAEAATAKPALVTEDAPPHAYADQTTCEESVQEQEAPNTTLILLHGVYFQKKILLHGVALLICYAQLSMYYT